MGTRLAKRALIFIAAALLLFGLVAWLGFMFLSVGRALRTSREELLEAATASARMVATHTGAGDALHLDHGVCHTYLMELEGATGIELRIVDSDYRIIAGSGDASREALTALTDDMGGIIASAFGGEPAYSDRSTGTLGLDRSVTVGVPIRGADDAVLGVLIAHEESDSVGACARQGMGTLALGMLIGFIIVLGGTTLVLPAAVAPMVAVAQAAGRIADGDNSARVGVSQPDEIGAFAQAIDRIGARFESMEADRDLAERMRREFITDTSRELRIPAEAIARCLDDLEDSGSPEDIPGALAAMRTENTRLRKLIVDLTDLTALESRDCPLASEPVDLRDLAWEVMDAMQPEARRRGVEMVRSGSGQPMPFAGDRTYLGRMLAAAVDNALRYAPAGSTVMVGSVVRASAYTWSVVDWGPGIPPAELPHVFERYYRIDRGDGQSSSGLGLSLAQAIADRHGIRMEVDSRPGKTEFIFVFPAGPQGEIEQMDDSPQNR